MQINRYTYDNLSSQPGYSGLGGVLPFAGKRLTGMPVRIDVRCIANEQNKQHASDLGMT